MRRHDWLPVLLCLGLACDGGQGEMEYEQDGEKPVLEETVQKAPSATEPADTTVPATAPATQAVQPSETQPDVVRWTRPRFRQRRDERRRMAAAQMDPPGAPAVTDSEVLEALRHVPRHRFVPVAYQDDAYADTPLPIGHGQTISQPYIVGLMTQLLGVRPGDKVLEVGTGSGYQAAVLSELTPSVYTIEIIDELGDTAAERFEALKYNTIRSTVGDGYFGWKEHAPYDAIIVTCAATHVPQPLVDQLKPDGVMCIPVGSPGAISQNLTLVRKAPDGTLQTRSVLGVRFVPLTGGHRGP